MEGWGWSERRALARSLHLQARAIVLDILGELPRLDVKDVDEHLHVPEDVVPLRLEVVLHECLLPSAVP